MLCMVVITDKSRYMTDVSSVANVYFHMLYHRESNYLIIDMFDMLSLRQSKSKL
jgi:hypothetical protein